MLSIKNIKDNHKVQFGYSDHTIGVEACLCAVSLGARVIEKHITLDKRFSNFRDHQLSADFEELKTLVYQIRKIENILGSQVKHLQKGEKKIINAVRRKPFASKKISKKEKISEKNLNFLRSSKYNKIIDIDKIINKRSKKNFEVDQIVKY